MKKKFPQLELHNIFFSKDYETEFSEIFKKGKITDDPTIYINITSKLQKSHAPEGKENWFVMINAPSNIGQDWDLVKKELRANVISKINSILQDDIEPLIEEEEFLDPVLIERQTASYMGSLYGSSSNSKMSAFLRQANFSNTIAGLYFCGGSVHPGGGIPLCLKSAKIIGELINTNKTKVKH